ncbi:mediator of DNA damage checkpoint protein 1-like isoform X2 [Thrips palmi]|uniref:Mediator of DNA damage checkpoint protein 1 n=1 Tax=Thrips palmi TaxID=161013 RepID=A0A6P8YS17_THRPL|nr:mediator of DNA damage checkpoint protein 1-like isoform X2 [Thrips palmi]
MASEEFECTQVLHTSFDTSCEDLSATKVQVATLKINEAEYSIFNGDTKIGRDPKQCLVAIDRKSVSSHHALIEVESGHHIICDLGSSNSTRLNGMLLKPNVRYNLPDGAIVQVADLRGTYHILPLKKPEMETSVQDIFDSPCNKINTPKRFSLNDSDDIIESTPMRKVFKKPFPKIQPSTLNESVHLQDTIYGNQNDMLYEAETQIGSDLENGSRNSSSILSETLDDSVAVRDAPSFFVPCTQDMLSESSLNLHYDTDKSVDASTSETKEGTVPTDSAKREESSEQGEVDLFLNAEEQTVSDPSGSNNCQSEYDMDCEDLVKHVEKIERSLSSESMNASRCQETMDHLSPNKQPAADRHTEMQNSCSAHDSSTRLTDANGSDEIKSCAEGVENPNNIHDETDEEGLVRDSSNANIHDAKTQCLPGGVDSEPETGSVNMHASDGTLNIHDAKTQIVSANDTDSETDEEGVYGACTEMPHHPGSSVASKGEKKDSDDIHDAKTQFVSAEHSDSETDEEGVYGASTERAPLYNTSEKNIFKKKNAEDIHDAKTQIVPVNNSDSETDEEGVYGACTEKPQILASGDTSEDTAAEKSKMEEVHNAETQYVVANCSASDTDHGDIYRAGTEKPESLHNIHDAKTQLFTIESASNSQLDSESILDMNTNEGEEADIHDAKTQMVSKISDSETDDERVYGASTERPGNVAVGSASEEDISAHKESRDIHDAKTQMVCAKDSDSETDEEGVYGACTEKPGNLATTFAVEKGGSEGKESEDIHDAKTQMVCAKDSDSETDEEGVYGACTEKPGNLATTFAVEKGGSESKESEDIHDAKTQMVLANDSDSGTDDNHVYGACTEKAEHIDNIHNAQTQLLTLNRATSHIVKSKPGSIGTKNTNGVEVEEDNGIHDAKTQMLISSSHLKIDDLGPGENFEEADSEKKDSDNIHDAKTQIVHANGSDSETDEEGMYGACTERLTSAKASEDIHEAKTQVVSVNDSDSETDEEGVYGACTEQHLDVALTNASDASVAEKKGSEDIHGAKTQIISANESGSETDEEGVYGACTERIPEMTVDSVSSASKTPIMSNNTRSKTFDSKEEANNIHIASTEMAQFTVDKTGTAGNQTSDSAFYDAETQILPELLSKSENVHHQNVAKQSIALKASPKKRLSLSYRKKMGGANDDSKRRSVSPSKGTDQTNEDNISTAATQLLPNIEDDISTAATQLLPKVEDDISSAATQMLPKVEDDICSAATQKCESPRFSRRLKGITANETAHSFDSPKTPSLRQIRNTDTSTPFWSAKSKLSKDDSKSSEEDMCFAATQILPDPGSSRIGVSPSPIPTRNSPGKSLNLSHDIFNDSTRIWPSPGSSRKTRSQNSQDNVNPCDSSEEKPSQTRSSSENVNHNSPGPSYRRSSQNLLKETDNISEPSSVATRRTPGLLPTPELAGPGPRSSRRTSDQSPCKENSFSASGALEVSCTTPSMGDSSKSPSKESTVPVKPSPKSAEMRPALGSTELSKVDPISPKPSSSRRSVSFAENIQVLSNPGSTTQVAGIEKLSKSTAQTRSKRSPKKRPSLEKQGNKKKRHLGSSVLEVDIEESSSDSNKSQDCLIDEGSPLPAQQNEDNAISDAEEPVQARTSTSAQSPMKNVNQQQTSLFEHESTSPIVSRSKGRRTLSLSRSKFSPQGFMSPEGLAGKMSSDDSSPKLEGVMASPTEPNDEKPNEIIGNVTSAPNSQPSKQEAAAKVARIIPSSKQPKNEEPNEIKNVTTVTRNSQPSEDEAATKGSKPPKSLEGSTLEKKDGPIREPKSKGASTKGKSKKTTNSQSNVSAEAHESAQPQVEETSEKSNSKIGLSGQSRLSRSTQQASQDISSEASVVSKISIRTKNQPSKKPIKKSGTVTEAESSTTLEPSDNKLANTSKETKCNSQKVADSKSGDSDSTSLAKDSASVNESTPAKSSRRSSLKKQDGVTKESKPKPGPAKKIKASKNKDSQSQDNLVSDGEGRRTTRARRQPDKDIKDVSAPQSQGGRPTRAKRQLVTVPEDHTSAAGSASQTSNSSAAGDRRSSRLRKQTVALKDYDCSGESQSQESSSTDQVSAASSSDHPKGRKSSRNTKQKNDAKSGPQVKGVKRISSDVADQDTMPSKQPRTKSDLSLTLETSVQTTNVLDISAGPSSLKRENTLNDSVDSEPESKRRRGRLDSVASINSSPRRSPRQSFRGAASTSTIRILFSFYNNPRQESFMKQLGASIVNDVDSADVLVTDKLRRTVKLLSIVGKGLPVVSPSWLLQCKRAGRLLDPWEHLLSDLESEAKFNMKLEESLKKAAGQPILQDQHIFVTESVKPEPEEMKAIILSCGGHCLPRVPSVWPNNSIIISCEEDKNVWSNLKGKVSIVSAEWLLSGVLRQQLESKKFLLKRI